MCKGIWDIHLIDDGTLDTVFKAVMRIAPHITYECRYSDTSEYRDEDGSLTLDGFTELTDDVADFATMQHGLS
jgi:hypothetical protein